MDPRARDACAVVADLKSTLEVLEAVPADILLLDLTLSPTHELDALRTVAERFPTVRVLVLSSHSEARFGIPVLKLGAAGYIPKSLAADVVPKAIRKVHGGGRYLSESLAKSSRTRCLRRSRGRRTSA